MHPGVGLARACHPLPTAAVTTFTAVLAALAGYGPGRIALLGAAVSTGQLTIGWLNDLVDADRDAAGGRRDKPLGTGELSPRIVRRALALATVACIALSCFLGASAAVAHLVLVAMGWLYDLRLKSSLLSWLPYLIAFGLLPAVVVLALPGAPLPAPWLVAGGALLGVGAHFLNVVPDVDQDRRTGVRGLPQRLGADASRAAGAGLLLSACGLLLVGPGLRPPPAILGLLGALLVVALIGVLRPGRVGSRLPFAAALSVVGISLMSLALTGAPLTAG